MNQIRSEARHGRLATIVGVAWRRQTYRNLLYLLVSLPLGTSYFAFVVGGLTLSLGGAVILSIPAVLITLTVSWRVAGFERGLAIAWLGVDIPPMSYPSATKMRWWERLRSHLRNPMTWKALTYLVLKFPFGVVAFVLSVTLTVLPIVLMLSPVAYVLGTLAVDVTGHSAHGRVFNVAITGRLEPHGLIELVLIAVWAALLGLAALHLLNGVAYAWGQFARHMLGLNETAVRLSEARATADLERAKAARADRSRHELIVNVSHELRTPIASIRGHVESLLIAADESQEGSAAPADQRAYLSIIHRETERLSALVDDLLSLARAEAGELRLEMAPVAATEAVEEVFQTLAPLAYRERRVTVVRTIAPGLPPVMADRQRLCQVLLNLVRNAITYTPAGGLVSIALQPAGAGHLALTVADTGMGIAPEDLERVFERFYRTDASRTRASGGFGLGLAIARDMIEAMGGSISVESTVGEGTCFQVQLCAAPSAVEHGTLP